MKSRSSERQQAVHPFVNLVSLAHSEEARRQAAHLATSSSVTAVKRNSEKRAVDTARAHFQTQHLHVGDIESIQFLPVNENWQIELDVECLKSQVDRTSSLDARTFHVRICGICSLELRRISVEYGNYRTLRGQVVGQGTSKTDPRAGEFLKIKLASNEHALGTIVVPKSLLCPCGKAVIRQFKKH